MSEELESELEEARAKIFELEEEVDDLSSRLQGAESDRDDFEAKIETLTPLINELYSEI